MAMKVSKKKVQKNVNNITDNMEKGIKKLVRGIKHSI